MAPRRKAWHSEVGHPEHNERLNRLRRWGSRPASLQRLERGTLAERAADQLRRRIVLGAIPPGRKLEPMRALAAELGVSLAVVREAVAELRSIGLVQVRHGIGVFVARRPRAARVFRAERRRATRREIRALRRALEPLAAGEAARRPKSVRAHDVRLALFERVRGRVSGDLVDFTDADFELHQAVLRASGNVLAAAAGDMAARALWPDFLAHARALAADEQLNDLHEQLVDAIENGHELRARRAARLIAAVEEHALRDQAGR